MKTKFQLLVLLVALGVFACTSGNKEEGYIADENIDMSTDMLMSDESPLGEMPEYSKVRGGASELIDRSFENSPPLIPHKTQGMLPITIQDNKCLRCHLPDNAKKFEATPTPQTHFTSYRPVVVQEESGLYKVDVEQNEVVQKELGEFNNAMYNCSQCHVAQANVTVDIDNVFNADYRNSNSRNSSNLNKKIGEGVK